MLAVRASTTRSVQHIARTFATVVEASGVKVASVDHGQPNSAVTVLMKAGSRFQPKAGVAQALKNFAFKVGFLVLFRNFDYISLGLQSTAKRSALGTVRETELFGGILSATLGREHLALTAEFLRGDECATVFLNHGILSLRFISEIFSLIYFHRLLNPLDSRGTNTKNMYNR